MKSGHPGRRRRKPAYACYENPASNEEERLLQQAITNSKLEDLEVNRPPREKLEVPAGPTFFPSVEEFEGNTLHYINKIRPIAQMYGIAKIVPPPGWNPPFSMDMKSSKTFQTKEQMLHRIQEGLSFDDGEEYCASDYLRMAQERTKKWIYKNSTPKGMDDSKLRMAPKELEKSYWDAVEVNKKDHVVEYGNDVDTDKFGSGFPRSERGRCVGADVDKEKEGLPEPKFGTDEFYKESYWNLQNIPNCPDSILQHIKVGINGINVPWLYFGDLFTTFCWHNEDNYLYSINYNHWGAPKQWYGIPGTKEDSGGLEKVFKDFLSSRLHEEPDLLHHITTMFSPRLLQLANVPVYTLVQHPGEFVVTFPRAFHGGFSMGPNIGEAVNFATYDWIPFGSDANERYRSCARPSVFSQDRLTFTMANNLHTQKSYYTCKLLIQELKRVIDEEMGLRSKLLKSGVRDVSMNISLPKNRLGQLDDESADYDDKRLCHACKHVCFFSCVACECSQSKVSCLRHSHFMCRCPIERRYLMVWSPAGELKTTLHKVQQFADQLKVKSVEPDEAFGIEKYRQPIAPGSLQNESNHLGYEVDMSQSSPLLCIPATGATLLERFRNIKGASTKEPRNDIESHGVPKEKKIKMTHSAYDVSRSYPRIVSYD